MRVSAIKADLPPIPHPSFLASFNEPANDVRNVVGDQVPLNPVKSRSLTQLVEVRENILPATPAATHTFGAVAAALPTPFNVTVLVMPLAAAPVSLNPPVPEGVKPVDAEKDNTVAVAVLVMLM